ncbi:hypothetical protein FRC06_003131 [Ceratobasidium sp. 370]|nr:hypothetical protein FRC06_003131 [Ceratobasidium sp. 370]
MHNAGTLITRSVAQSVTLAFIQTDAPELFHDPRFKCSESFIRHLLHNELNWSWHATMQAAQKLPSNWEDQCVELAHRLTWNIMLHNIPPELVINADQTGVSYLGTGHKTWELKGVSQVPGFGQDKKRQFTLMVAVMAAGQILPFQAIYKGTTKNSLPSERAQATCKSAGFVFTSGGHKHWSNLKSMQEWVIEDVVVFANKEHRRLGLPPTQKIILIIDCWSVHRGAPFRNWMKEKFPWIILLFIPGGCTSVAQPCDTRVNRVLKHRIKSACVEYLAEVTQNQLRNGVKPSDVEIDTTPGTLRNASASWIMSAWDWLKDHPQLILDSWESATFKGWDLSYKSLTSLKSRSIVHERFTEDQDFALSIVQTTRQMPDDPEFEEEDSRIDYDDDCALDPNVLVDI